MGGSGGGSSSGKISYPAYLQSTHNDWLDHTGVDTITSSVVDFMNAGQGNSPWTGQAAYDPDADITAMITAEDSLQDLVTLLSNGTTLDTLISSVLDESRIDDAVDEYAADLAARLTAEVIPRFERGMQDINAVSSSAFVIGRALIEEGQDRQVAKYSADLHMRVFSEDALRVIQMKLEYQKFASHMLTDIYRMRISAKVDENQVEMEIDDKDARWDIELFQYGGNLIAAIGGGTMVPKDTSPSKIQSAIGGAMSGAVAGAMIGAAGGPIGMAGGAFIGAASALL